VDKIEEVLTRGVQQILPDKKGLYDLMSKRKIKLYQGFDPSMPSLHLGNFVGLMKLRQFQKLGHEVIFLVGDFTGMIGDPTDKLSTRPKLTREEVLENAKTWKSQASKILDFEGENSAKIMFNSEWLDKVTFKDLIEISSNFTVQQLLERDMFQKRIWKMVCINCGRKFDSPIQFGSLLSYETASLSNNTATCPFCNSQTPCNKENMEPDAIYLHELLYPIAQAQDSVAMDVDLEIGGNDQLFNMMAGRTLMKAVKGKEKFVLTTKLLVDAEGKKVGKTTGNALFLNSAPEKFFEDVMDFPDEVITLGFELLTEVPMEGLEEKVKLDPYKEKLDLAFQIVTILWGRNAAIRAKKVFKERRSEAIPSQEFSEFKLNPKISVSNTTISGTISNITGDSISHVKNMMNQNAVKYFDQNNNPTTITRENDKNVKLISEPGTIRMGSTDIRIQVEDETKPNG
jgi:tyrosyl-tRNA synthetase